MHSQKLSEPPLRPWVLIRKDGTVVTAHCTCMAGLGEACSHVAALLFAVECGVRQSEGMTCTDIPCAWKKPASGNVPCATLAEIDFTSPRNKQRLALMNQQHVRHKRHSFYIPPPSSEAKTALYEALSKSGKRCAILSHISPYNE